MTPKEDAPRHPGQVVQVDNMRESQCSIPWCTRGVYETNIEGLCAPHWDMWRFNILQAQIANLRAEAERQESEESPLKTLTLPKGTKDK